jgi:hypothetical protein
VPHSPGLKYLFVIFEAVVPLLPVAARLRLLYVQIRRILIGFDKRFESSLPPVEALPRFEPLTLRKGRPKFLA